MPGEKSPSRTASGGAQRSRDGCRCACGNLLARITERGIEVKCRRCKRVVILELPTKTAADAHGGARAPPLSG